MSTSRKALAVGVGGAAALAAGWIATQRHDARAVAADPHGRELFADFGGSRSSVRAADGTALWVRSFGPEDAPALIFVHGWTCAAEFWKLQARGARVRAPADRLRPARTRAERAAAQRRLLDRDLRPRSRRRDRGLCPGGGAGDAGRPLARGDDDRRLGGRPPRQGRRPRRLGRPLQHGGRRSDQRVAGHRGAPGGLRLARAPRRRGGAQGARADPDLHRADRQPCHPARRHRSGRDSRTGRLLRAAGRLLPGRCPRIGRRHADAARPARTRSRRCGRRRSSSPANAIG